jgi:probable HAF family extracellular repeat protein
MPLRSLSILTLALSASALAQPSFTPLGDLPGGAVESFAYGLSGDGQLVVGRSRTAAGIEPFRWTRATGMVSLGTLDPASFSIGRAVSPAGDVIVGASGTSAVRWSGGATTPSPLPGNGGALFGTANALTPDTTVTVGRSGTSGVGPEAFRWTSAGVELLRDLPGGVFDSAATGVSIDGTIIAGYGRSASGREAARWVNGVIQGLGDLPGGFFESFAEAISGDGVVVVGQSNSAQGWQAFRWSPTTGMQGMGDLPGGIFSSHALAITPDGATIVGYAFDSAGRQAFVWTQAGGMTSVRARLTALGVAIPSGWRLEDATAVSHDGLVIAGFGVNPAGQTEAWIADLRPVCGSADFNGDGDTGTDQDIEAFFACLGGTCCAMCGTSDFNNDADFGTDQDIEAFFRVLAGAPC